MRTTTNSRTGTADSRTATTNSRTTAPNSRTAGADSRTARANPGTGTADSRPATANPGTPAPGGAAARTPLARRAMRTAARRPLFTALAGAALCGATLLPGAPTAAATDHQRPAAAPERQLIASSTLGEDRRITLTAVRSAGDGTAATVRLATFVHDGGGWIPEDRVVVGERGGWFWYPLTGSGAVCEFSTSSAGDAPIAVSLLITPSIGCSDVHRFHIENGEIVPG
ncbi:hypothetical protein [Streptomyces sp. Ru87]|uniref:hypothetical protein n=1 Tax=Streptomyces sp. Ru87 TaxID=2044307 RepID=UPI00267BFFF6|nr:hypothetical protein [Streptomyces sp. Ru87]